MTEQISITPHEYKMLMDGYHPEFESDDDPGEFVEQGKGADIIYRKAAFRKSDKVEFWFEYAHNTEGGFNHDEPRDGNFKIDHKKEDTLDPFDELGLNEPEKVIEVKPRTIYDDLNDIKDVCVDFDLTSPTITHEELVILYKGYKSVITMSDLHIEFDKIVHIAVKYKLTAESIKGIFDKHKGKPQSWLNKYKDDYNEKFGVLTEVIVQGQVFHLTTKQVKSLRKSLI